MGDHAFSTIGQQDQIQDPVPREILDSSHRSIINIPNLHFFTIFGDTL
jgi:hypothetical protein